MEQALETIGARLREARKSKKLTAEKVQEHTGISKGNLSTLETDKSKPSSDALIALSTLYDVSIDWLLKGGQSGAKEEDGFYKLNGLPDVPNKELAFLIKMILEYWKKEDETNKAWTVGQLRRAFPDIAIEVKNLLEKTKES